MVAMVHSELCNKTVCINITCKHTLHVCNTVCGNNYDNNYYLLPLLSLPSLFFSFTSFSPLPFLLLPVLLSLLLLSPSLPPLSIPSTAEGIKAVEIDRCKQELHKLRGQLTEQ